ncbi:hypothetical protein BBI11_07095 [Planococcus maritimus]|nr:hypothetical protein BBI11_07095 [Planococcus maritimus]
MFFSMKQVAKYDAFLQGSLIKVEKRSPALKLETEWKEADACGTARAGETNVSRTLRHVGSTPAPRQAAP